MLIRRGSLEIATFLDDIFEPIGIVADQEISYGVWNYQVIVLVVTKLHCFACLLIMEFENKKSVDVDFVFYSPFARCAKCFFLDHYTRFYLINHWQPLSLPPPLP